jgi:hypothetical protein
MRPTESLVVLQKLLAERGTSPASVGLEHAVSQMLTFYRDTTAEGCDERNADMLLYQWGTYDWGQGEAFEIGVTRQFIEQSDEEARFSQLQFTLRHRPTPDLRALGAGSLWCEAREDASAFSTLVQEHVAYRALAGMQAPEIKLEFSYV